MGDYQVRFSGEGVAARRPPYPTNVPAALGLRATGGLQVQVSLLAAAQIFLRRLLEGGWVQHHPTSVSSVAWARTPAYKWLSINAQDLDNRNG